MQYHINNKGDLKKCIAKSQSSCKYPNNPHESKEEYDRMIQEWAENNNLEMFTTHSNNTIINVDNKAIDPVTKEPLTLYHGTSVDFSMFQDEYAGKGNDEYGGGFYFTTSPDVAATYGDKTKQVQLTITNPIILNGEAGGNALNDVFVGEEQAIEIIKNHPCIYQQPDDDDNQNPLSDFCESYWDKDSHSQEEMNEMIKEMVKQHFQDGHFTSLENLFTDDHNQAFRESVTRVTGYDGIRVDLEKDNSSHWIAWNTNQINIIENNK